MAGGETTVKINKVCPHCYSETGYSIVMAMENNRWYCPKNARHQFTENEDGFLEIIKTW